MINVEAIVKVMRADLPAHFDKAILASELDRAKNWYWTRSKLDKWPKRGKIIGQFVKDTERYRAAVEAYSEAAQNIPLPFRLPSWLNTEALDDVVTEAKAGLRPLDQSDANKQASQKTLLALGVDRGSPMDYLLGSMLPKIFRKCFNTKITVRASPRTPKTPFVRFAVEAARQIAGKAPSPETVASSYRTMNVPGAGRRRARKPTVQD
jgi:hypothetical protein